MIKAIFQFLANLLSVFLWWRKKADAPAAQYEKAKSDNAKAVLSGDTNAINRALDSDLDRVPDQNGDSAI